MKKVSVVIGTRPEAIKMAPVVLALREHPDLFAVNICSTGQHTTMIQSAMAAFGLKPDKELEVMQPGQPLIQLTSRLLLALDQHFEATLPDLVLVHGDTTSAMAGALAAFYRQIDIGHIEAGLRTGNLLSPFPEEYNRRSVAIATHHHFAPTQVARKNLENEGVSPEQIIVTGNTVIDALKYTIKSLEDNEERAELLRARLNLELGFDPAQHTFILITAHRRENFGVGLKNICFSIRELAKANPSLFFLYPVHLNPEVKSIVYAELANISNVVLTEPKDYITFAWLLNKCLLVLTDSGGIQEEAPALGKPVLVMRETSERPEAIAAGTAKLVTTKSKTIIREVQKLIDDKSLYAQIARAVNPFGDGQSSSRIIEFLIKFYAK